MSGRPIIVARAALLPALSQARQAVARHSTIPILQNLLLSASTGTLSLTGTDLDAEILATCACNPDAQGSFTLPAATFFDVVRKLPDAAEISIDVDTTNATVASGRTRFKLPILPAGDFPLISAGEFACQLTLPAAALAGMIDQVGFAVCSDESRYYLNGIFWHPHDVKLMAAATDGHRLAQLPLKPEPDVSGMPPVIIPRRTIALLKAVVDEGEVLVKVSATRICFSADAGKVMLTSKLVDGTFPEYQRVMPAGNANQFRVGRAELSAAVDRVTTVGMRGSAVRFSFGREELHLRANNPDSGSAEETIAVELIAGEPVEIGFNGRYCLDMLAAAGGNAVTFALGTAGEPALVTPAEGDARFVLMPMRV